MGRSVDVAYAELSRRERQILDILYRLGQATAAEVQDALPDPPGYSAVRSALRLLEQRGVVQHQRDGQRYVYEPKAPKRRMGQGVLSHVLETFFDGSRQQAVSALLEDDDLQLTTSEYRRLADLLEEARRRGGEE
ncbi:MAG: BlaI/MecI/CopY family transcriptional regulator [Acidobacteriota bacterium]